AQGGGGLHSLLPRHRLPDGLRHCARRQRDSPGAADAHRAAVLDLVPAAGLCLDRAAEEQRRDQQPAHVSRRDPSPARAAPDRLRGLHRHRVLVPAVHDPAAVREPREARRGAPRSGGGSRSTPGARGRDPHSAAAGGADPPVPALPAPRARGRPMRERRLVPRVALVLGLAFLYGPILSMIVFSFNNSRLVTVWDAAHSPTLKWYGALLHNEQILRAAWLSIRIAVIAASVAVVLGTLAGTALARLGAFRGRLLLAGMVTAPIVMPEVITGLSLL